ncbi:MAG: hypothetical protein VX831_00005, partial [Candidatus Thermoplasmatota archaeon]|nr:hypothetical protein [Candidatus Thermoplasmatota archaeon]
ADALGIPSEKKKAKHLLFTDILEHLGIELKPAHMSSGATITTEGILAIETGVLGRGVSLVNGALHDATTQQSGGEAR